MGGIWFDGAGFRGTVSEMIGKKSGFALTLEELLDHTPSEYRDSLNFEDSQSLRIRSEEFQELICECLYSLGTVSTPYVVMPGMALLIEAQRSQENSEKLIALHNFILKESSDLTRKAIQENASSIDPTLLVMEAMTKFGTLGHRWAMRYFLEVDTHQRQSIMSAFNESHDLDPVSLTALFKSESLETPNGQFIDQRFVDYLQANPDKLFDMHWRKFEGLTAEYFDRQGYSVEIGPGRNDGGVDIRIWDPDETPGNPPVILVQCKRHKDTIQQGVVKALWTDVLHEKAKTGLVVTTSRLAPSSDAVIKAREYAVDAADGNTLKAWLLAMRTPDSGVFMSE